MIVNCCSVTVSALLSFCVAMSGVDKHVDYFDHVACSTQITDQFTVAQGPVQELG